MRCPACGGSAPDDARFCPTCGQSLYGRGDERRVVTVLFADLVGFTGLSETRDPEQVKNLADRCFERLAGDVTAYGGRVDNIVGDAIVALFGAPVAHEDDAERAVRAALQMVASAAGMGSGLGADLRLRVGVNTGVVLVGAVRGGGDYTAMGDVVNVASRLQGMAEPGHVVVGPLTHEATQGVVQYEPLGPVQARGREEPVEAWVALGCLAPPGSRPHRAETPLVGRQSELGMLHHALDTATARRRAQLILLLGEAGVGKSRLAEAIACRAREQHGAMVLEGRCVPYGEANVWWPVAEAIREAAGIEDDDPNDVRARKCRTAVASATGIDPDGPEATRLTDGLLYLMGDEGALADVDPQRARDEARRSLQVFVEGLAHRQPLVVVLSELHWAHEWVLEGIDRLLERLRHVPVVIVCTARPDLEDRWAYQPSHRNLVLLHVDPLDEAEAAQLLTSLLGSDPAPEVRELLLERSGGNPLFLEELVGLLREEAVLGDWSGERPAPRSSELPATLRGLVAARLDALGAAEREALEDAAVVGRTGSLDALVALGRARGEASVAAVLDQLAGKDLLAFEPGGEWEFRSALVREVAYETLTKAERARRHSRLAEWMGGRVKETGREDEVLEQLAHHYGAAAELVAEVGQVDGVQDDIGATALVAVYKAAHRALERDLYRVALHLFDLGFRLVGPGPSIARRRLLLERASAQTAVRDLAAAHADVEAALAEAAQVEDLHSEAKALTQLGRVQQAEGDYAASAASLDRALDLWDAVGHAKGRAQALSERGITRLHAGDPDAATADLQEALAAFKALGIRKNEAWAQWNLAYISFAKGDTGEAEERLSRAARAFEEVGDYGGLDWVKGLLGYVRNTQGRRAEAERLAVEIVDDARERGDRWALAVVLTLISTVRLWEGRTEEAIAPGQEALALFRSFEDRVWEIRARWPLCRALAGVGRVDEAVALAEEGLAATGNGTPPSLRADAAVTVVAVALHLGEPARAFEALAAIAPSALEHNWAELSAMRGLALLQTGRPAEAAEHLETAVQDAPSPGPRANAVAVLALAGAAMGRSEDALAQGDEALAVEGATYNDRTLALLARAFALLQLGRAEEAVLALDGAGHEAAPTGDRGLQAHVLLARGRLLEALGDPSAPEVLDAAGACRAGLGLEGGGWDTVFRMAAAEHRATATS